MSTRYLFLAMAFSSTLCNLAQAADTPAELIVGQ
jgi:hypothetical protein